MSTEGLLEHDLYELERGQRELAERLDEMSVDMSRALSLLFAVYSQVVPEDEGDSDDEPDSEDDD